MRCVCGHPDWAHRVVAASVPLRAGRVQYQIVGNTLNHVYDVPDATYEQQQCPCGCSLFDHDRCEYLMTVTSSLLPGGLSVTKTCRLDAGHRGPHVP